MQLKKYCVMSEEKIPEAGNQAPDVAETSKTLKEKLGELADKVQDTLGEIGDKIEDVAEKLDDLKDKAADAWDDVKDAAEGLKQQVAEKLDDLKEAVNEKAEPAPAQEEPKPEPEEAPKAEESQDEPKAEPEKPVDLAALSLAELSDLFDKLSQDENRMTRYKEAEAIKSAFYKRLSKEKAEAGFGAAVDEPSSREDVVEEAEAPAADTERENPFSAIEIDRKSVV